MASQAGAPSNEAIQSFEKGIDRNSPRTNIKTGGYEDAQNMVLLSGVSGKHPTSMALDSVLDPLIQWPPGNPQWVAPFSFSAYDATSQILSLNTHMLVARAGGQYHRYDAGSPGTTANVRRLINSAGTSDRKWQINHFAYDKWLCVVDGRNTPFKYGQHFVWSNQFEPTPFLFPIGSRPISPMTGTTVGESWVHTQQNQFVDDAQVPRGARVSTASLLLNATGSSTMTPSFAGLVTSSTSTLSLNVTQFNTITVGTGLTIALGLIVVVKSVASPDQTGTGSITAYNPGTGSLTFSATSWTGNGTFSNWIVTVFGLIDYTLGPQPYGGRTFTTTDSLVASFIGSASVKTSGTVSVDFHTSDADYRTFKFTPSVDNTAWSTITLLLSTATSTGAPDWTKITYIKISRNDSALPIFMDDLYFLYSDAPPAAQVGTSHKDRIVLGGAPLIGNAPSLGTIAYSNAQQPDNYANSGINNTQNISGGFESLAKVNQITALREYQDSVIVGTPSAIFAWTVGSSGSPAKSTISTEHGIDSHRGVIETPNGSLLFPWQKGFYILRATGRQFVGAKIQPILSTMATDDPSWTMTVLDEGTKTLRTWFREGVLANHVTNGITFDYGLAQETGEAVWPSRMTQMADWAVPVYINGTRSILYTQLGSPQLFLMNSEMTGSLTSFVTLPWLSRQDDTKVTKWMGLVAAYSSTVPVDVFVRYANNPGEFDAAPFTLARTLPENPTIAEGARVGFGGSTRWVQVKFQATTLNQGGFEIFPPVHLIPIDTQRSPN